MFGFRPDGRRIILSDPIVGLTPYLMPQRIDAQVHAVLRVNCDTLTQYIRKQRDKGHVLTYMDLIIAAYVRAASQFPEMNRFVVNKQLYARKEICVSLTILKTSDDQDDIRETAIKPTFSPYDTVYDIHDKMQQAIEENRKPEVANSTDKLAKLLLSVPGLPTAIVGVARLLDRYGLLPRVIIDLSPFHTGLFLTNMASIGMPHVNHHIYNFGTTSVFLAMGKVERNAVPGPGGTVLFARQIPIGVVSDERITSGAEYGRAMGLFLKMLEDPSQLEVPPETIRTEYPVRTRRFRRHRRHEKAVIEA